MAVINIKGVIVTNDESWIYKWLGFDCVSPKSVEEEIQKANGEDLEVLISSPGGSVFAASEIYVALKSYPKDVVTKIVGWAASAASIIAMGGKRVLIAPTAEIMIHNVASRAQGDYRAMDHQSKVLKDYNSTIANAYVKKSGMSKDKLLKLMDDESWITPELALEYGLVDGIMFEDKSEVQTARAQLEALKNKVTGGNSGVASAKARLEALRSKREGV